MSQEYLKNIYVTKISEKQYCQHYLGIGLKVSHVNRRDREARQREAELV